MTMSETWTRPRRRADEPLPAYGYARVPGADLDADVTRETHQVLVDAATAHGMTFATMFIEPTDGTLLAFDELVERLHVVDGHHVLVPSGAHLGGDPRTRRALVERLKTAARHGPHRDASQ